MTAPKEILDLVERFERNRDAYRSAQYNETQLRREFLDPFFNTLGWDVENRQGYAEAYKDVIHEDAIKIGGFTKAPDYCFRIGGARKFFVEAKKPAVDIRQDASPAFQLRRYAWSAKLPLSILTDFEEFALYDCRIKPANTDKASTGRIKFLTYAEYAEKWDEIASIFSREAVLKGSFDKYAETSRIKKGTAEVDAAFLMEIESWRDLLARNLAVRNPGLSQRELNFAVQRTIDRIIFLRICEDRGIEIYGRLMALLNGPNVYARLLDLYRKADERYNSGLFHFREEKGRTEDVDRLTPGLAIDDKALKEIIRNLYYPDSPYELSVLPADILGQVYEQFLGKVIRLTAGHQAKVEDKPEVKKAGGVFYTPTYIVEYIVRNTVGRLLEGKTPNEAAKLKILDPACGSGSFLIGAFQRLLDWHRDWFVNNGKDKWAKGKEPALYQGPGGEWRLTTAKRKEILVNNIYGVDIDPQAVEVTKLSLLLKVLEGESDQSLTSQLILFHQRALPDLGSNIKCGNSLIGSDFYRNQQLSFMDEEERLRLNVFDWEKEFPKIFTSPNPGFDAVIGNPPYVRQESLGELKDYLKIHYASFDGVADLYVYFLEKGIRLLHEEGILGIIVSSSFLRTRFAVPLRIFLKNAAAIERIVDFGGQPIFANAKDTYVCIPIISKSKPRDKVDVCRVEVSNLPDLGEYVGTHSYPVPREQLKTEAWSLKNEVESTLYAKIMQAGVPLGEYVDKKIFYGVKTGLNEAFELTAEECFTIKKMEPQSTSLIHPVIGGQDIRRYRVADHGRHLIVIPNGWTRANAGSAATSSENSVWEWFRVNHPSLAHRLRPYAEVARKRQDKGEFWWELRPCTYYDYFISPKIIFPDITKEPRFHYDVDGLFLTNTAYCLGTGDLYLLGILNSMLFWFAIGNISIPFGVRAGQYRYRLIYQYMEKVPVRAINFSHSADRSRHDRMVQMVEQMLSLHKQLAGLKTSHEKTALQRQIDATDHQIDQLVYELYGLTDEEIRIVETSQSVQG
jgi:hypothetical protein